MVQRVPLEICGVIAAPGEKRYDWIEVTRIWNGPFRLPLIIANGKYPGKTLLILAMQHGDEYDGFEAGHRILAELDPDTMHGSVVFVPCVNIPAFVTGARRSFLDGVDMNRVHPGKRDGYFTQQIVHLLDSQILPKADAVIDLHGGNLDLEVLPYVGLVVSDEQAMAMARATGIPSLYEIDENRMERTLLVTTRSLGIPQINLEAGGGVWGRPETIDAMTRGIRNVLCHFEIVAGEPADLPPHVFLRRSCMLSTTTGGVWRSSLQIGQHVRSGQQLGTVVDLLNQPLETLTAPADGFVQDLKTWPKIWPGDWVVLLGVDERMI